jgi:hypothetical protein
VKNNFVFKHNSSDHSAVFITLDNKRGVSGSERETIDEELTLDLKIQAEVTQTLDTIYSSNRSEVNKWTQSQGAIRDILMKHTKARKKETNKEIKILENKLKILNVRHASRGATPASSKLEQSYQRTMYELQHPEVLREPSINEARNMYESRKSALKLCSAPTKAERISSGSTRSKRQNGKKGCSHVSTAPPKRSAR